MTPIALIITHRTLPGERDAAHAVWLEHMRPAIAANPGHEAYSYCFDPTDADVICAFQQYSSPEDAAAFLRTDAYLTYEAALAPLLTGPPEVRSLTPLWSKGAVTGPSS